MPGNQSGGAEGDVELKVGYMVKRSQGKSTLGATNFKKRVFVLTPTRLAYYDGTMEKRGGLKGYVDLSRVKVIEKVLDTAFDKPSLQLVHGELFLYMIASSTSDQEDWLALIRQRASTPKAASVPFTPCKNSPLYPFSPRPAGRSALPAIPQGFEEPDNSQASQPFVPPHMKNGRPSSSTAVAAQRTEASSRQPLPLPPPVPVRPPVAEPPKVTFEVMALYDYNGIEKGDLPLQKGQKLLVIDNSREYWWKARDANGREGFVPSNYVRKAGLESEDWFFPNLSRARAEGCLKTRAKRGACVSGIQAERTCTPFPYAQMYTLSICHEGQIRHYHIKQDEASKYYISEKHNFPTIKELIEYHKLNGGGLVTRLRKPPSQAANGQGLEPLFEQGWEIDKNHLVLGKELGSGQFGRVVAGKWNSVDVAIKMMKEGAMNQDDFIEEARVMKRFKHENLVRLYGVCTNRGPVFIVTELMVNGCLLQYLRQQKQLVERVELILDMAVQICSAMKYLEANGFIHRDLAARNCLVGERNVVKVADFGLARFVTDDEYTASEGTKFPIKWAAPEVITHAKFSSKSDVWSYGILQWELWTGGKTPYPTFTNPQVLDEVLMGYRLERPKMCPVEVYQLMGKCWQANPECRPSFGELYGALRQMQGDRDDYSEAAE
eukprot:Em0022g179a